MSSSRFPGKVLADLAGQPMIAFMIERVRRSVSLDGLAVVTSTDDSDDPLVAVLDELDVRVFRGSLDDVLGRYAAAADMYDADVVVRLTGDCPLVDPAVIDTVVAARAAADADYASNIDPPTFADGLDVECFTRQTMQRAEAAAATGPEREHVTLWMRTDVAGLRRINVVNAIDTSPLRLTVDYPDDLEFVRSIVELLGAQTAADVPMFDQFDVMRCLFAHPELMDRTAHMRNEGLARSLAAAGSRSS
jgi:spore coat polysaccharide biosynthesis protein SpsF